MSTASKSDATPAYRGYRLQTLYTLSRILTDNKRFTFRPEGKEDLEILDHNYKTLEIIQVKAHTDPLTLSDFSPEKEDSFFRRVAQELKQQPHIRISIVSFGKFGPELDLALKGDEQKQQIVAKKLAAHEFLSEKEARHLISKIQPVVVEENPVREHIDAALQENSITGGDHDAAFDLLMFWLYQCAEHKTAITHHDVIEKFTNIGRFINDRHAYHQEWFTIIEPIEYRKLDEQECSELSREFYEGISARYDHILAELDVERHQKMQEIAEKFGQSRVVIIHAASGQGKTTLAYRYLHDVFPNMFQYQVKLVEDRRHAYSIARALIKHAEAIGIPIAVYYDVSADDRDWGELVKELSKDRNILLLVTIREEDFRRASISGAEIQFSEVELNLQGPEAEEIFQSLTAKQISAEFLNFEEVWNRFGGEESSRPLMEFVYLVTQGDTLRERLQQQINRIRTEINRKEYPVAMLDLLRVVAVASAFEAKLKYTPLVQSLDLPVPEETFRLLEKEYSLLKLRPEEFLIVGLHPIRSAILTDILTTPPSPSWAEIASTCFPFIHEPDLEVFLLYAFSRHQEDTKFLLNTLMSYQPERWVAIGGIVRALIWLGISDYVKANQALIWEIFEVVGESWYGVLDFDIADAVPGSATEFSKSFGKWIPEAGRKRIQALQVRQTNKKLVFSHVKKWLAKQNHQPTIPTSEADWSGMAETVFWIGYLHIQLPVTDWISEVELDKAVAILPLEILANLVLGLSYGYGQSFLSWLERNRPNLTHRFCQETNTIVLEDDGQKLTLHFLLPLELEKDSQSEIISHIQAAEHSFHEEAIQRIWLLRRLLPDRDAYASRGYGHRIWGQELPIDETDKPGVSPSSLPLLWLRSINSTFRGLVNYSFRPENWPEYMNTIFELRKTVLQALEQLERGLNIYFRKHNIVQLIGNLINGKEWDSWKQLLIKSPLLPGCAVDEWGSIDEFASKSATQEKEQIVSSIPVKSFAIRKYKPFLEAFGKYTWQLYLFFEQSPHVMVVHPQLKKSKNMKADKEKVLKLLAEHDIKDYARLSTMNFGDAVKILPKFQKEFRQLLGHFLNASQLHHLERQEQLLFKQVWNLWYYFAFHPNRVLQNPEQDCSKHLKKALRKIKNALQRELRRLSSGDLHIKIVSETIFWEDEPTLWITIDGKSPVDVYNSCENVIKAIQRSVHKVQNSVLHHSLVELNWLSVAIVPLIRGKSLNAEAWHIIRGKSLNAEAWHIKMLILSVGDKEEELKWWNLVSQSIPQQAFTELGIERWNIPRLEVGARLFQSITVLSLLVAHIRDFERIPDMDEQGKKQLQTYIQYVGDYVSQVLQSAMDSVNEMIAFWNELSPSQHETRPHLVSAMQGLAKAGEKLFPKTDFQNEIALNMEETVKWSDQLEETRNVAFLIYSSWVADVLEEINV